METISSYGHNSLIFFFTQVYGSTQVRVRVESQVVQISDLSRTRVESLQLESTSLVGGLTLGASDYLIHAYRYLGKL